MPISSDAPAALPVKPATPPPAVAATPVAATVNPVNPTVAKGGLALAGQTPTSLKLPSEVKPASTTTQGVAPTTDAVAKDLTKGPPASPFDSLGGTLGLPRVIDRVRAEAAGTQGEYNGFPAKSGGDSDFIKASGVDPEALKAKINSGANDADIAAWVKANATPPGEPAQAERAADYRSKMLTPYNDATPQAMKDALAGEKAELAKDPRKLDLTGATTLARLLCIDEGYPIPAK